MKKLAKGASIGLVELDPSINGKFNGDIAPDFYGECRLPGRALPTMHGVFQDAGYKVKSYKPSTHGVDGKFNEHQLAEIFSNDVLAVSYIIRTEPQTHELVRRYLKEHPGGLVIAGGQGLYFRLKQAMQSGIHYGILREGERTGLKLLEGLSQDTPVIPRGVSFNVGNQTVRTEYDYFLTEEELSSAPIQYFDEETKNNARVSTAETSRGCPKDCDFCGETEYHGGKYRKKSIERVISEFKNSQDWGLLRFCVDDNFPGHSINDRARSIATARAIYDEIQAGRLKRKPMIIQASVSLGKDKELLEAYKRIGVEIICFGIESLDDDTLKEWNKGTTAAENINALSTAKDLGFYTLAMTMFGSDSDTPEKGERMLKLLEEHSCGAEIFAPIPLEGTRLYQRLQQQERIIPIPKHLIDGSHVASKPRHFSPYDLQTFINDMNKRFWTPQRSRNLAYELRKKGEGSSKLVTHRNFEKGALSVIESPQMQDHLRFLKSMY